MTWTPWEKLTDRERQVLIATGRGLCGKESARELGISHLTLRRHLQHALRKLGAHTKTHAVIMAQMRSEITLGEFLRNNGVTAPAVEEKAGAA